MRLCARASRALNKAMKKKNHPKTYKPSKTATIATAIVVVVCFLIIGLELSAFLTNGFTTANAYFNKPSATSQQEDPTPQEQPQQEDPQTDPAQQEDPINVHAHTYGDWMVMVAPTCTMPGTRRKACECGDVIEESIPALGHELVHHEAQEPTCTTSGWSAYDTCSRCNYTTFQVIAALGHDLIHHAAQAPTEDHIGWNAYDTCSRCDYSTYVQLAALNHTHSYSDWTVMVEPTCTTPGMRRKECSCGDVVEESIAALGHNYVDDVCTRCGLYYGMVFDLNDDEVSYTLKTYDNQAHYENDVFEDVTTIIIPNTYNDLPVIAIGDGAFDSCWTASSIIIPDGVISIGDSAFSGCESLTFISIPDSVTSIGAAAFNDCESLTSISIPNSITSIKTGTFSSCFNLTSIDIPNSVTSIGSDAFSDCYNLVSINIPNSVTSIGIDAFLNCNNLSFNSFDNAYYLGNSNNPYYALIMPIDTNIETCQIHANCKILAISAFAPCIDLKRITVSNENTEFSSEDGILYNKEKTQFVVVPSALEGDVSIAYGVSEVRGFSSPNLNSVIIPDSVTRISQYAFIGSSISSITIPNTITYIGNYAFARCSNLTSIVFQGAITEWTTLLKSDEWDKYSGTYTIHCTDGDIAKGAQS